MLFVVDVAIVTTMIIIIDNDFKWAASSLKVDCCENKIVRTIPSFQTTGRDQSLGWVQMLVEGEPV